MEVLLLVMVPLIGAATGWVVVSLSIKVLFWPAEPVSLPFNRSFQGLLPGKRRQLAVVIREVIEGQLRCAVTDEAGIAPGILAGLTNSMVVTARERVNSKIPAFVPGGIRQKITAAVEDIIRREIPAFVDRLADNMECGPDYETDFGRWAEDAIRDYDLAQFENKVATAPETLYLKTGAAILGFVAGLLQLLVVWAAA